jgi:thiol-disulfide isomerase/thioredoxin
VLTGLIVLVAVLAVTAAYGTIWQQRNGRMRSSPSPAGPGERLTAAEIGTPLGGRATLVQFSSAFCAPCRATRVLLADVASKVDGVTHVEIDAESHLDLVGRLDIRRTPTVLVLGPDGRITRRASGLPRQVDVLAALAEVG